jgi:6-pyruvoyltetrahydropterin/6-carboxytetrahydropterin synthase
MKYIRFTQQISISALHNLENPDLNELDNERLYGVCFRKHGHDYKIQIELECPLNERTGLAIHRDQLQDIINKYLIQKFQGSFLNQHFDCTSGEALSFYFYELLKEPIEAQLSGSKLLGLHIQETRKNWFSYSSL